MAHTKAGGSTKLGRDSIAKRLGVKISDGQKANPGNIIIRQRGSKVLAGNHVRVGVDDTLYAVKSGKVKFTTHRKTGFNGKVRTVKKVSII
ncbi:MAG TPA: 50S ribosomal protein L27 [Candidatus Paceibacterota bacterium]|nr:50S ribosomal protein L27 [Candidatus Paceibacterota bacterium]HPT40218.1 50S ribosomal protein L27 [Candidatus Paceibacterota bacterium]